MSDKNVKFVFQEKEFEMYNTLITAALVRVAIEKAKECDSPEDFEKLFTEKDYIHGEFREDVNYWVDKMSNGYFTLELFRVEEESGEGS